MAKGQKAKEEITKKILDVFTSSFLMEDNKTIRIPWVEDGMELEVKVVLTAAKDIIGAATAPKAVSDESDIDLPWSPPTKEETAEMAELLKRII